MIRGLDAPWSATAENVTYLTSTELLLSEPSGVVVRKVPGGQLVKTWMAADAERYLYEKAPAVVCHAEARVLVTPPRPMGLALVESDAPQAVAARLVVCTFSGEVVVRLDNSHHSSPLAFSGDTIVARGHYDGGVWDARTGRQRHSIRDFVVAASPSCRWLLLETRSDDDGAKEVELRVVSAKDLKQRWKRNIRVGGDGAIAAFVDEDRVVVGDVREGKQRRAELLDAKGRTVAKLAHPKALEDIRVVGDKVLLLSDTYQVKSQRILVATADKLRLLLDQKTKPVVALAADGGTAVMRDSETRADRFATFDTSDLIKAAKEKKPAAKKPGKRPATSKKPKRHVHHWFFGVPRSVTVEQLLAAGEDVHHMLDSPLRDLCVIIQPDDQVRDLRWFAFVARRRKNPYEYGPWIDTLADLAPLLLSVLHDELSTGTELRGAAYVDHRRVAAMTASSFNGQILINGKPPAPALPAADLAPAIVLRAYAPNEPGDHYLTALDGKAYRYSDGKTAAPKPVARTFVDGLTTPIDRQYPHPW